MQSWLLENARLGQAHASRARRLPEKPSEPRLRVTPRLLRILLAILIVLVIANVVAYVWVNSGSPSVPPNIQPTVTLANSP